MTDRTLFRRSVAGLLPLLAYAAILLGAQAAKADQLRFTDDLQAGDTSPNVRALQVFLNEHGHPLAQSGPGSRGHESDYFGALTARAVMAFQAEYGIPATGYVGPLTRAAANALLSPGASPVSSNVTPPEPDWIAFFNEHAPKGYVPGFGGGGVAVAPADTTPPTVSLTAPSTGIFAGSITLSATASDDTQLASVQFSVDGALVGGRIASAPFTYSWDSTSASDGTHTIAAVALDGSGNLATSTGVSVTIENTPPSFGFINTTVPGDGTATITWTTSEAADAAVFYGPTTTYGSSAASATLSNSHSIMLTGLPGGTYHFIVVSKNAAGVTATSTDQTFVNLVLS